MPVSFNLIGNAARSGGGIYIEGQTTLDIAHSRLEHNTALDSDGGGLWAKDFALHSNPQCNVHQANGAPAGALHSQLPMTPAADLGCHSALKCCQ